MHRPSWLASTFVAPALLLAALTGCHGQKVTATPADEQEDTGPVVQAKATGAVATLSVVVRGADQNGTSGRSSVR